MKPHNLAPIVWDAISNYRPSINALFIQWAGVNVVHARFNDEVDMPLQRELFTTLIKVFRHKMQRINETN